MIKNGNWRWIKRKNLSADLSFMSHIRASLCYEMKFKTKYFLAAVACDGEHYIKMAHNLFLKERKAVKKRQPEENTFGWRLMRARTDRQMSQNDVIEKLAKYKGKDIVSFCQ